MQSNHGAHFSHALLKVVKMVDIQSGKAIKLSQAICPDVIFLLNKSICVCIAVYYESSIVPHYCGVLNVWFDRNGDLNGLRKHVYVPFLCALSIRLNCRQNDDNKKLADATHLIFSKHVDHTLKCVEILNQTTVCCVLGHFHGIMAFAIILNRSWVLANIFHHINQSQAHICHVWGSILRDTLSMPDGESCKETNKLSERKATTLMI